MKILLYLVVDHYKQLNTYSDMVYIHLGSTPDTRDLATLSITPDTTILLKL